VAEFVVLAPSALAFVSLYSVLVTDEVSSSRNNGKPLADTFWSADHRSLRIYRKFLISDRYASTDIGQALKQERWCALSGGRSGKAFHRRASFLSSGKPFDSWAMLYPNRARMTSVSFIGAIARTNTPGAGQIGFCDE
jgi:hypothetical protein